MRKAEFINCFYFSTKPIICIYTFRFISALFDLILCIFILFIQYMPKNKRIILLHNTKKVHLKRQIKPIGLKISLNQELFLIQ